MKKQYKINEIYGKRIKEILTSKNLKQRNLANLLAQYEIDTEKYSIDKSDTLQLDSLKNELTEKYIRLISRWVCLKAEPSQRNISAISKVLNISEEYIKGYRSLPYPLYVDDSLQMELNTWRNKMYLFQYIDSYLGYDLNFAFDENNELLFHQIEQEIHDILTARIESLGISKKRS